MRDPLRRPIRRPTAATLAAVLFALCALFAPAAAPQRACAATSAIFGRERLFTLNAADTAALKSSYSTVILFVVDVEANGDLNYNGNHLIVQNGRYVGDPAWGARMAALKAAPTTINRIEVCTGGAGAPSFVNIRNLIASQGTGPDSILYRNFQALQSALGVDAIDYDDEVDFNAGAAVAFGNLIASLGMRVTLCPYNNQGYWQSVKSQLGGKVDAVYLQCYDGGAGNDPSNWNGLFGGLKVQPGDWDVDSAATVQSKMAGWAASSGATGGFIWLLDDMSPASAGQYAAAVNSGIGGPLPVAYFMIVNKSTGMAMDLIGGDRTNGARINQWSYDYGGANQRWAVLPTENADHFKIISWVSGKCACIDQDSTSPGAPLHDWDYVGGDPGQQFDLVDVGSGDFKIRNVKSGLVLADAGQATSTENKIQQQADGNADTQMWRLQPWGNYRIREVGGRYICCQGASGQNGAPIIQYNWESSPWFDWQFVSEGAGWYALSSLNAPGRVLCVDQGSSAPGISCHLWDYNPNNAGDQKVRILPKTDGKYKFYFEHDGMSWDMPGGQTGNNVPLQQYPDNGNSWQEFSLERLL